MRLLNTITYELHEFLGQRPPQYVILSHRWGSDEATYQDSRKGRRKDSSGHRKILQACDFAREVRRQEWLWIDTCCIDKRSSAELTEAINSMFNYYREAWECIVYLSDVSSQKHAPISRVLNDFAESKWFTRGWTLQELLAPTWVFFCDSGWEIFWTKNAYLSTLPPAYLWKWGEEMNGTERIADISGLPVPVLRDPSTSSDYSLAQRLSWASSRITSRLEDQAYCLLGILDINMPLMYGERNKAFVRLQQELIRTSVDESILSWSLTEQDLNYIYQAPESDQGTRFTALLASSPAAFADEAETRPEGLLYPRIQVESGLVKLESGPDDMCYALGADIYFVYLRCQHRPSDNDPHPSEIDRSTRLAWSIIALRLTTCGHFVRLHKGRVKAPFNRSDAIIERVNGSRCGAMTFYIHASSDCTMARMDRRSKEEDTSARMAAAPANVEEQYRRMRMDMANFRDAPWW